MRRAVDLRRTNLGRRKFFVSDVPSPLPDRPQRVERVAAQELQEHAETSQRKRKDDPFPSRGAEYVLTYPTITVEPLSRRDAS